MNIEKWYNKFCKPNKYNYDSIEKIALHAASLSYRASVLRALYQNGQSVGFCGKTLESKECRLQAVQFISDFLLQLYKLNDDISFKQVSDMWDTIRSLYHAKGISWYTYGNAQKWVGMAIKYFFVIAYMNNYLDFSHPIANCVLPIDRIIMNKIKDDFGIPCVQPSWSQCDSKELFEKYIMELKDKVKSNKLLDYEIESWDHN